MKKLYLDDIRMPHDSGNYMYPVDVRSIYRLGEWDIVRNYKEFVAWIELNGLPDIVSFDHDLEPDQYIIPDDPHDMTLYYQIKDRGMTGYDCAKWLVNYCVENGLPLPKYLCHSMNPIGKENILSLLCNYEKTLE